MLDMNKFLSGSSQVEKAFGNWFTKDTMTGQIRSPSLQNQWSSTFPSPFVQVDEVPSDTKSFLYLENSLLSHNEDVNKSQQSSSRNSHSRPNSIPIIDPHTGMEVILASSKYPSHNLDPHKVKVETLGIKRLENSETNKPPESLSDMKLDPPSHRKAFECSSRADNMTDESDLLSGLSQITNTPGGRHNPRGMLGSTKSSVSRMGRISGSRNREGEVLTQKINLKLVNLQRDGVDVVKGLGKVKDRVEGLLQVARTTVEKFGRMDDKMSEYSSTSQFLVEVGDEMTLLTASLSLWQNTMLDCQECKRETNETSEHLISSSKNVKEKQICEREQTQIESLKDVLVESLDINKREEVNEIEHSIHGGNLIPIMNILNDEEAACHNISTLAKTSPQLFNQRSSNGEESNNKTTNDNQLAVNAICIKETWKNYKHETSYYMENFLLYKNKTCANNKPLANEEKKLIEQLFETERNGNSLNVTKDKDGEKAKSHILLPEEKLSINPMNIEPLMLTENAVTELNETEKEKHFKITQKLKDIEKAESVVLSPEGKLNLRLEKLDVKLGIQNLRSSPLKSHSQILKDITILNLENNPDLSFLRENDSSSLASNPILGDQLNSVNSKQSGVTTIQSIGQALQELDTGYKGLFKFTEGCPSLFWIHKDSPSLVELENYLEARYKHVEGDGGGSGHGVVHGSSVLAKYSVDGKFYRARVEEVMMVEVSGADCMYSVRYSDYGNSEVVTGKDIQSWDRELDCIPDQAVSCCLADGPQHWRQTSWKAEQLAVFHQIVGQSHGNITVELGTKLRDRQTNHILEPMFEAFVCHGEANVVESLRKHHSFAQYLVDKELPIFTDQLSPVEDDELAKSPKPFILKEQMQTLVQMKNLDPTQPKEALPLLNLTPSPWVAPAVFPQEPGSPIPSVILRKAKSKVNDWLENKCQDAATTFPSHDASSVKSFRAKLCSNNTLQSKGNSYPSRESFTVETFPTSDEEAFKCPSPSFLDSLKILEDTNGTFLYFMSMVENPGKFYIHPVQTETASLDKIHAEIIRHSLETPKEYLVLPETVWALCNQFENKWYRVRIENRYSTTVSVRYIDYGSSQERISFECLRHLPDTSWVNKLPGLALRCHLAGCSPKGKSWNSKSTEQLEKMLGYKKQHRGVVVGEEGGSMGVVLLTGNNTVINHKMVEWQFAVSEFVEN